jgi:thiamine-monophosphate kinase
MASHLKDLGERAAIELVRRRLGRTPDLGGGEDDCAAIPLGDGRLLLATTDVLIGATHIIPGVTPEALGRFAVEVAVSDVAAMGGRPIGVLCALGLPPRTDSRWLASLSRGMARAAGGHATTIVGGDTKSAPVPTLAMTALGTVEEARCLYRRGAMVGDALVLTGPVGGPGVGYQQLRERGSAPRRRAAVRRLYGITARVEDGLALAASGHAHACIDLSDGLGPALHQLMGASGRGARVRWDDLPLARGLLVTATRAGVARTYLALHFGGEYELLAAVDPAHVDDVLAAVRAARPGARPAVIGEVTRGHEILLELEGPPVPIGPEGFDHFRGNP